MHDMRLRMQLNKGGFLAVAVLCLGNRFIFHHDPYRLIRIFPRRYRLLYQFTAAVIHVFRLGRQTFAFALFNHKLPPGIIIENDVRCFRMEYLFFGGIPGGIGICPDNLLNDVAVFV